MTGTDHEPRCCFCDEPAIDGASTCETCYLQRLAMQTSLKIDFEHAVAERRQQTVLH